MEGAWRQQGELWGKPPFTCRKRVPRVALDLVHLYRRRRQSSGILTGTASRLRNDPVFELYRGRRDPANSQDIGLLIFA